LSLKGFLVPGTNLEKGTSLWGRLRKSLDSKATGMASKDFPTWKWKNTNGTNLTIFWFFSKKKEKEFTS
jgi:hypothetical protein